MYGNGILEATMGLLLISPQLNLVPDALIRRVIRMFIASHLRHCYTPSPDLQLSQLLHFVHCTYMHQYLFLLIN